MIIDGKRIAAEMREELKAETARLKEQGVVDLDEERKANMVSNLLVVLCGEENARPVVNTGSLYT